MEDFEYFESEFIEYLENIRKCNERSIHSHIQTVKSFFKTYHILNEETVNEFFEWINDNKKTQTVNAYTLSINVYIHFLEQKYKIQLEDLLGKTTTIKKVSFLEDIFTLEDYLFFMNKLKARNKDKLYIISKIMATTGMRIHETLKIRREHIEIGFIDFTGKGGKQRRCYFTPNTQKEVLDILDKHELKNKTDYVICSFWNGKQLNWKQLRPIQRAMSNFSENECEFKKGLFHPHAFRHFFAKNFIKKYQNIALLADLLGHSNIETTRIYLKYTAKEQQEIVNQVVTW